VNVTTQLPALPGRALPGRPSPGPAFPGGPTLRERAREWRDDEGAMMVIGVFMATLVVALLYYIAGIGETIVYREKMGDAADSGAFAAATIHARAMNLVALLNAIMAAVFAVLVAIRAVAIIYWIASGLAFSECCPAPPPFCPQPRGWQACIAGVALLVSGIEMCNEADRVRSTVENITDICKDVQDGLKYVAPVAALAKAAQTGIDTYNPPTRFGAAIGMPLPIDDDDSDLICRKAILPAIPLALAEAVRSMPEIGSDWVYQALPSTPAAAAIAAFWDCDAVRGKPKKVEDGVELGENEFQLRSFMFGDTPFDENEERVAVATWGADSGAGFGYEFLSFADRFSFAQGEYYYDGDVEREEWMWNMRWRARLRRFWLPVDFGGLCPPALDCTTIGRLVGIGDVVVH